MDKLSTTGKIFPPIDRRFIWLGLGGFTFLIKYLLSLNPYFTEVAYSRGLFLLVRWIWDYSLGLIPVPLLYLAVAGLIYLGIKSWLRSRRSGKKRPLRNRLASGLLTLLAWGAGAAFFFYFLWGFNYHREPLETRINLPVVNLDKEKVKEEFLLATEEVIAARNAIPGATDETLSEDQFPSHLESEMRNHLTKALRSLDYPTPGRVRGRRIFPKGILLRTSSASGVYLPWVGEGHLDAALPPLSRPFTMAHEMAHGYGHGDEGTCNFLAYLTCRQADDPVIRYAGLLSYWRETAVQYRQFEPEAYRDFRKELPPGMVADINAVNEAFRKYSGLFPKLNQKVYESYLKGQGIEEGLANYSRVVKLVVAWRKVQSPPSPTPESESR